MGIINLLHISDSHIDSEGKEKISEIANELCKDVLRVQTEKGITIDAICFSGDLIQSGANAIEGEKQWELAKNVLIKPVIDALSLKDIDVLLAPGNHEVNTNKIEKVVENGLKNAHSLDDINDLMASFNNLYVQRLDYFYDYIRKCNNDIKFDGLGYALTKIIQGIKVGFACVDSAWRSSGKGYIEKGNLYVGVSQIKKLYSYIEDADLKVCIMHHPVDWLMDAEASLVERELGKFDIVLNGHVHENDMKHMSRSTFNTIYSTAGKLYPLDYANGRAVDGYNGYSIVSYDTEKKKCKIYVRSYFGMNRNCFDAGINICENGEWDYSLRLNNNNIEVEYGLVTGVKKYLREMSEKFSNLRLFDKNMPEKMENVLVEPKLSRYSDYVKEREYGEKNDSISLEELVAEEDNQLIIGKRETGKTTILQNIGLRILDDYDAIKVVPLFVDMQRLCKGRDRVYQTAYRFASENMPDDTSITKELFKEMSETGHFNLLIDNLDVKSGDHCKWVADFMKAHPNIGCFVTVEEEFFQVLDVKQLPEVFDGYNISYIQYFGKNQIRQLVSNWSGGDSTEVDDVVRRIDRYCNHINFAKTPFNISIFMVIWDFDGSYIPANEGLLMQNYLEIVLEKLSPNEARFDNYSFSIKEDFLSELAYYLYNRGSYAISYEDFMAFVSAYHKDKGYNLKDSKFDKLFFEKNILTFFDEQVVFSRTSFLEYFLAVYAVNNDDFLDEMLVDGQIAYFGNEICFYAGLKKDSSALLDRLSDKIMGAIVKNIDLVDALNGIEILTEFKMDKEEMLKKIEANRLSIEEADSLSDSTHEYKERKPNEITKVDSSNKENADDFYAILITYAGVLKNAELLSNDLKVRHLENYMYGMNMLYGMLIKMLETVEMGKAFDDLTPEEKERINVNTEEDLREFQAYILDMTKLVFPIALQHLIIESVGTPKLIAAIDELIKSKKDCPFEKFMLVFLKSDMGIVNLRNELSEYIKNEKSRSILKIVYLKLTFYYKTRIFGNNEKVDKLLLDLITEVYMKLNPYKHQKLVKASITRQIKENLDQKILDIV